MIANIFNRSHAYVGRGIQFGLKSQYRFSSQQSGGGSDLVPVLGGFFAVLGLGMGGYMFYTKQEQKETTKKTSKIDDKSIEKMRIQAIEEVEKKKEEIITMFEDVNDKMLRYRGDPTSENMLADYTIYGDLLWYEADANYFSESEEEAIMLDPKEINKKTIKSARINERISHALEAERILQNIFVNVSDVLEEIQNTGTYTPPGIFMRFYGYLYFQIRNKPIEVEKLIKAKGQISLFDLYFKYQSPVLFYHNQYSEIPIRPAAFDNTDWIPNVYLNLNQTPKIYLQGKAKNVFAQRSIANTVEDSKYKFAWVNHYQK